jgi:hypothetical protein
VVALCPDRSCIQYTPRSRFSGYESLSYTAQDARGRNVTSSVRLRLATAAPVLQSLPHVLDSPQATRLKPLAAATVAYDDAEWQLTMTLQLTLAQHAQNAVDWPANIFSIAADPDVPYGSLQALQRLSELRVRPVDTHSVQATLSGNLSALSARAADLVLTPPPHFSGPGLLELRTCSQWDECTVGCALTPYRIATVLPSERCCHRNSNA